MEQEIKPNPEEIMIKLARLQSDMTYVREYIEDVILTEDDLEAIEESKNDLREGKTRRL